MIELIPVAKSLSRATISEYFVGAVGKTINGDFLLGSNIEFNGADPNGTIHGEHFLIANAFLRKEKGFEKIAIGAAPCGLCRQMINETNQSQEITMLYPGKYPVKFSRVLPGSFGPKDLGQTSSLLNHPKRLLEFAVPRSRYDRLVSAALLAAEDSYSPYIRMASGMALLLESGTIAQGSHFENAAFQKFSALNMALVDFDMKGFRDYSLIKRAVLVVEKTDKTHGSEVDDTRSILSKIAPHVTLEVIEAVSSEVNP